MQAEEDLPYLEKIREYYKNVCDEIQRNDKINDQKQIAVLAGILISDELFKEKRMRLQKSDSAKKVIDDALFEKEAERLTQEMIEKIDRALK